MTTIKLLMFALPYLLGIIAAFCFAVGLFMETQRFRLGHSRKSAQPARRRRAF
jgi:hypothetical protein